MSDGRRAIILVDLGFGDSGKGTMTDYLARRHASDLVIRHNGGPQAGHNVVLPDGRHHTFAQFGSGSFVPRVRTLLSRFMLIEPYAMLNEARHLESVGVSDAFDRLLIDGRCHVITPAHIAANRIRERARGHDAHGTCGMGVGECVADSLTRPEGVLFARDFEDAGAVRSKCRAAIDAMRTSLGDAISAATRDDRRVLDDDGWIDRSVERCAEVARRARVIEKGVAEREIRASVTPIFEGAQGVLLDESHGFAPHSTWSRTTRQNADRLLTEAERDGSSTCIGITRTYATRHGAGPFPSEDPGLDALLPEPHNASDGVQGRFRRGHLDLAMMRYAIEATGPVDELAVTHLDALDRLSRWLPVAYLDSRSRREIKGKWTLAQFRRAEPLQALFPGPDPDAFCERLGQQWMIPVKHRSWGPTFESKRSLE